MKSIIEVSKRLIEEKKDFVSFEDIINELGETNLKEKELKAMIYTDLVTSGIFFFKENKFNLMDNFTIEELKRFRSEVNMASIEDIQVDSIEEENLDVLVDSNFEEDDINVEEIIVDDMNLKEVIDD